MFFQLLGIATVAVGIRDVRKLFGKPSLRSWVKEWLARFPLPFRRKHAKGSAAAGAGVLAGLTGSGQGFIGVTPDATARERISALENQVKGIIGWIGNIDQRSRESLNKLAEIDAREQADRENADGELNRRLEESAIGGITLEIMGVVWLTIGIVLASASIELARWCSRFSPSLCTTSLTGLNESAQIAVHLRALTGDWLVAGATLIAALGGAATGSGFAYWLESRRRQGEDIRARVTSINRALFVMHRYWSELLPYRQTVIDPVRGKPYGWLDASASVAPVDGDQSIDNGNLGFLLEVRSQELAQVLMQQDRFRYAAFLINEHSRALMDAHEALASHGAKQGQGLTDKQLAEALGPFLTLRLKLLLEATTLAVDQCLVSFQDEFRSLRRLATTIFPDAHFIEADFVEPLAPQTVTAPQG